MKPISFKRHRFPPEIIRHAIWLYGRFTLSFRDVEEWLAERGVDVSHETVRRWFLKFGLSIAADIRRSRPRPSDHWHLDETAGGRSRSGLARIPLRSPIATDPAQNLHTSRRRPGAKFSLCFLQTSQLGRFSAELAGYPSAKSKSRSMPAQSGIALAISALISAIVLYVVEDQVPVGSIRLLAEERLQLDD